MCAAAGAAAALGGPRRRGGSRSGTSRRPRWPCGRRFRAPSYRRSSTPRKLTSVHCVPGMYLFINISFFYFMGPSCRRSCTPYKLSPTHCLTSGWSSLGAICLHTMCCSSYGNPVANALRAKGGSGGVLNPLLASSACRCPTYTCTARQKRSAVCTAIALAGTTCRTVIPYTCTAAARTAWTSCGPRVCPPPRCVTNAWRCVADAVRDVGKMNLIHLQAYRIRRQGVARQGRRAAGC